MTASALTLREALTIVNDAAARTGPDDERYRVGLACSCTPLHLDPLVRASVQRRLAGPIVELEVGLYGDLAGGLAHLAERPLDACVVVVEWPDLDPRLGMRESTAAPLADLDDLCATARARLDRVSPPLRELASRCAVVVVPPTLALPPAYATPSARIGALEAALDDVVSAWVVGLSATANLQILDGSELAPDGPRARRRDLTADLRSGFPYTVAHASALAGGAARLLVPAPAKKGLITDLDDTFWRGLVGEIGPDAVAWDLDAGSHVHALYQQVLARLASTGVLLGVASKNDPEVVRAALRRPDLLVQPGALFPVAASWDAKSASVAEILGAWNVGAGDVVYVDDNPMELAEVEGAHAGITTLLFRPDDPNAVADLLEQVNELFWRTTVTDEDRLRLASIRSGAAVVAARRASDSPREFLVDLGGRITIDLHTGWQTPRALDLVNKTNQFNLNGRRVTDTAWRALCTRPGAVPCTVSYEDRFGPLGVVSALVGQVDGRRLTVDGWVLSCRAFSRAIEHHVLAEVARQAGVDEIAFDFVATERNGVVARFLASMGADPERGPSPTIDAAAFSGSDMVGVHSVEMEPAPAAASEE